MLEDSVKAATFSFEVPDGLALFVYRWLPEQPIKAVVSLPAPVAR